MLGIEHYGNSMSFHAIVSSFPFTMKFRNKIILQHLNRWNKATLNILKMYGGITIVAEKQPKFILVIGLR